VKEKFQCLGKIKDKKWYDLILGWIVLLGRRG